MAETLVTPSELVRRAAESLQEAAETLEMAASLPGLDPRIAHELGVVMVAFAHQRRTVTAMANIIAALERQAQ